MRAVDFGSQIMDKNEPMYRVIKDYPKYKIDRTTKFLVKNGWYLFKKEDAGSVL